MGKQQRGGTILGLIIGLILGLGIALGVAVYVTKVPVPFLNKGEHRDIEKSEQERNRSWDPNSPLYGGSPSRTPQAPAAMQPEAPGTAAVPPAAIDPVAKPPAASADPLGDLAKAQVKAADAKAAAEAKAAANALPMLARMVLATLCKRALSAPRAMRMRSAPSWPCWAGKRVSASVNKMVVQCFACAWGLSPSAVMRSS